MGKEEVYALGLHIPSEYAGMIGGLGKFLVIIQNNIDIKVSIP